MNIPFLKAHGAKNDFLLTWAADAPPGDPGAFARAICDRHTGVGADGWMLVEPATGGADGGIRLYNSDGSPSEISGNGTRCAAAFLLDAGADNRELAIRTGAGVKRLRLLERHGLSFQFEMDMGRPAVQEGDLRARLPLRDGEREAAILDMGNPQCAVFVDAFDFDWRAVGREIEWHPRFPNRTNVSFVKTVDAHTIEVRIWERGAGETLSSGTGCSGAAAAAILRGLAASPVDVRAPAGTLPVRWDGGGLFLQGPAEITARGVFHYHPGAQV